MGSILKNVSDAIESDLKNKHRIAIFDMQFLKPLDEKILHNICNTFKKIITVEDGVKNGGFGSAVLEFITTHKYEVEAEVMGIPDRFIEHGTIDELQKEANIDIKSIQKKIRLLLKK